MSNASDPAATARLLVISLVTGGMITIAVAILLGATVSPALYAIAVIGLIDFALAWAYSTGRRGPLAVAGRESETAGVGRESETAGTAAFRAQADPSHNPYARED